MQTNNSYPAKIHYEYYDPEQPTTQLQFHRQESRGRDPFHTKLNELISRGDIEAAAKSPESMKFISEFLTSCGNLYPIDCEKFIQHSLEFLQGKTASPPSYSPTQDIPPISREILKSLLDTQFHPDEIYNKFVELDCTLIVVRNMEDWLESDYCSTKGKKASEHISHFLNEARSSGVSDISFEQLRESVDRHILEEWVRNAPTKQLAFKRNLVVQDLQFNKDRGKGISVVNKQLDSLDVFKGAPAALKDTFQLDAINNQITSFMGVSEIPHLEKLYLSKNHLSSLEGLQGQNLVVLDISQNFIDSIGGIPEMPRLEHLDLSFNPITSVSQMPECPQLGTLALKNTFISSLNAIPPHMLSNPTLRIDLSGSPLDRESFQALSEKSWNNQPIRAQIKFDTIAYGNSLVAKVRGFSEQLKAQSNGTFELQAFGVLLNKLPNASCFQEPDRVNSLYELLEIMEKMVSEPLFREFCFNTAVAGLEDCHDYAQSSFEKWCHAVKHPAYRESATLQDIVDYDRQSLNASLVMDYVSKKLAGSEALESQALLMHELSKENIDLFGRVWSKPTFILVAKAYNDIEQHKMDAKKYLEQNATDVRVVKEIASDSNSMSRLNTWYPEKLKLLNEEWYEKYVAKEASDSECELTENEIEAMTASLHLIEKNTLAILPSDSNEDLHGQPKTGSFEFTTSALKEALDELLMKLPKAGTGWLFQRIRDAAETVCTRETAQHAFNINQAEGK